MRTYIDIYAVVERILGVTDELFDEKIHRAYIAKLRGRKGNKRLKLISVMWGICAPQCGHC
jgi:hypothetical protein